MRLILLLILAFPLFSCVFQPKPNAHLKGAPRLETVTWYWLNSADGSEWEQDFRKIKEIGIDRVVLWYGWNASLIASEIANTKKAIDLCHRVGLDAYLGIWSGTLMHLKKGEGIFNSEWQQNWFQPYLQKIHENYNKHPSVKGYYLDDTFAIEEGSNELVNHRKESFQNWGKLLRNTLAIEKTNKELIFSDYQSGIDEKLSKLGLDWNDIVPLFSRIMIYNINVSPKQFINNRLKFLSEKTQGKIPLSWGIFTFVIGEKRGEKNPHPTIEEWKRQIQEAREAGVAAIDFYAFRVGDWNFPYEKLKNPMRGPENPSLLLRYRSDLQSHIPH